MNVVFNNQDDFLIAISDLIDRYIDENIGELELYFVIKRIINLNQHLICVGDDNCAELLNVLGSDKLSIINHVMGESIILIPQQEGL